MKSIILAATLFAGALGCDRAAAPAPPEPAAITSSTTEAMVSTPPVLTLDQSQGLRICPFQWFCESSGRWFGLESSCVANCSVDCFPDFNCSRDDCICP